MGKIGIIGSGLVGATFGYALTGSGVATEVVLIDVNRRRAEGEAMDLNHSVAFAQPMDFSAGDYPDLEGASVVVITAGANQKPGQTRLDLAQTNVNIFRNIVPQVVKYAPAAIIVVVANPVDVLTYATIRMSGLPPNRVFGSGTTLDTGRLRYLLGDYYGIDPRSVHAYIIGEHGDSELPVWSSARVAGMPLVDFERAIGREHRQANLDHIFDQVRTAADEIIQRKGATYYAIGSGLLRIVESVMRDQNTVLPVSALLDGYQDVHDVCLSIPSIIGSNGVKHALPIALNDREAAAFRHSAQVLREIIAQAGI
jgi:L-lactate dehydrogenase